MLRATLPVLALAGIARWEVSALYDAGLEDTVSILGQALPLPLAGQCAALSTILLSLVACAAAWAALQRQVRMPIILLQQLHRSCVPPSAEAYMSRSDGFFTGCCFC